MMSLEATNLNIVRANGSSYHMFIDVQMERCETTQETDVQTNGQWCSELERD